MEEIISFFVRGTPAPGGSKTAYALRRRDGTLVLRPGGAPVINMTEDGKYTKEWRASVSLYARRSYSGPLLDEPLDVLMTFYTHRPKDHFRTGIYSGELRTDAPLFPAVNPDVLKLARSTEDALTGIIWKDDARTVELNARKRYAKQGESDGAWIVVSRIITPEPMLPLPRKIVHPRELLPAGRPKAGGVV